MLYNGLLLSVFLDYVRPGAYIGIISALKIGTLVPLAVLAFSTVQKSPSTNGMVFGHPNTKWLLFFWFLLFISIFHADVTFYSYKTWKDVLAFLFWYYIISRIVTDLDKIRGFFILMVLSHVIILILNPQIVLDPTSRSRVFGNPFMGDGNDFSLSICIVIPMCLYLFRQATKKYLKLFYLFVLIMLILAIVGMQSRGASIAMVAIFGYLWWHGRQKAMGIMMILMGLFLVLLYAPPQYIERMNSLKNYEEEGSANSRIIAWSAAMRMLAKYPLTGVGSGHFASSIGTEFRPQELNAGSAYMNAHSMYFMIIGELGVPGAVFLFTILISNYLRNLKYLNEARGPPRSRNRRDQKSRDFADLFFYFNASLIGFCVAGAFLSVAYYPHLYVLAGICTACQLMFETHKKSLADAQAEQTAIDAATPPTGATGGTPENRESPGYSATAGKARDW